MYVALLCDKLWPAAQVRDMYCWVAHIGLGGCSDVLGVREKSSRLRNVGVRVGRIEGVFLKVQKKCAWKCVGVLIYHFIPCHHIMIIIVCTFLYSIPPSINQDPHAVHKRMLEGPILPAALATRLTHSMRLSRLRLQTMVLIHKRIISLLPLRKHRGNERRATTHSEVMPISQQVSILNFTTSCRFRLRARVG